MILKTLLCFIIFFVTVHPCFYNEANLGDPAPGGIYCRINKMRVSPPFDMQLRSCCQVCGERADGESRAQR